MDAAAAFLGAVLASTLEPFTLFGCVLAGSLLGRLWQSAGAATLWTLIVQKWIIKPRVEALQLEYGVEMLFAAILASWLATAIIYHIANSRARDSSS